MKKHKLTILIILISLTAIVMTINPPPEIGLCCFSAIFVALIVSDGIGKH